MPRTLATLILAAGAALAAVPAPAAAQDGPECRNAAVDYWRAGSYLRGEEVTKVKNLDWEAIGGETDLEKLPEAFHEAVKVYDGIDEAFISAIRGASFADFCDFHIEFENGYMALLPHLGELRNAARVLRLDARNQLATGNPDAAAERIAALYRMARHVSGDGPLISGLVAVAISTIADAEAAVLIESATLTEAGRETLLSAVRAFDAGDPFNLKGTVKSESTLANDWIRRTFTGPRAGKEMVSSFGWVDGDDIPKDAQIRIVTMDGEALRASLDRLDRYYDDALLALNSPRTSDLLAVIDGRVRNGEYGDVGRLIAPSFSKAFGSFQKGRDGLARTEALLRDYEPPADAEAQPAARPK